MCPLVVIRAAAAQVRVAAILVSEACYVELLAADSSPHHRHRFVSVRAGVGSMSRACQNKHLIELMNTRNVSMRLINI